MKMGENSDDNDPFEEDIVFDQSGLLSNRSSYSRQQSNGTFIPTFMIFIRTVFLCVSFIGLGLCSSVSQGPLIHLEVAVGVATEKAFHSFTAHCFGMLIGGLLGAVLFELYNRQFLIFVGLLWMSVSISILPFTIPVSYWWTLLNLAALGCGLSFLFTGSNVLCLDLWGKRGGASLQSLHFSYAIGAFIAPIIIQPLLSGSYSSDFSSVHILNVTTLSPHTHTDHHRVRREITNMSSDEVPLNETFGGSSVNASILDIHTTFTNASADKENDVNAKYNESLYSTEITTIAFTVAPADSGKVLPTTVNSQKNETTPNNGENVVKVPKPKPSFTNANLIPEHSKWKRPPPPKEISNIQKQKAKAIAPNTTTTSTSVPSTLSMNDTSASPSNDLKKNVSKVEESKENETAIVGNTNEDSPTTSGISVASLTTLNVTLSSDNDTRATLSPGQKSEVISEISTPIYSSQKSFVTLPVDKTSHNQSVVVLSTITPFTDDSRNLSSSTSSQSPTDFSEVTTAVVATSEDSNKYAIDFSNHSYLELPEKDNNYDDEFPRSAFSDYSIGSVSDEKSTEKISTAVNEPEVLDLKEYSEVEDAPSTSVSITTTSSPETESTHQLIQGHQSKPGTFSNVSDTNIRFFKNLLKRFRNYGVTSIHFVYICVGGFLLLNGLVSIILTCHNPREPRSKQEDLSESGLQRIRVRVFICAFSLYMFTAEALQGAVHHLLASSHTTNGISPAKNVDGAAIFWGLMCSTRFLCILVSGCLRIKPSKILVVATFMMVLGSVFLCVGTFNKPDFLWGGIIVVAIGLAPVLPTSFLWMAEHMRVSHRMCALMIVVSSIGNTITHTTLAHVRANSHLYAYILVAISVVSLAFFAFSCCFLVRTQTSKSLAVPGGYHLASQEEEETLELTRPTPKNFDSMSRRLSDMGEAGQALLID